MTSRSLISNTTYYTKSAFRRIATGADARPWGTRFTSVAVWPPMAGHILAEGGKGCFFDAAVVGSIPTIGYGRYSSVG
ncbi:hypothetical protein [Parapedobacter koreensis]|uniref:hypothetical protein n=1 Tax=Parapedobacter koreensis TaxID=332977 RepID=UPI00115F8F77|nr:hypothetical protein [Parapedobacter koreensis]